MAGQRRADDRTDEQCAGKSLKRRGILAAAGVVVAGLVAKQVVKPVAAADGQAVLTAGTYSYGGPIGLTGSVSSALYGSGPVAGLLGIGTGQPSIGVDGGAGIGGVGVRGAIPDGNSAYPTNIGVLGTNTTTGGIGVQGQIGPGSAAPSTIAVYGLNYSTGSNTSGVYGAAAVGNGVVGASYGTGVVAGVYGYSNTAYGVIGTTTAAGYSGLTAITGTPGVAALAATSTNASAYAAYFQGTTVVQGNFAVVGGNKSAAVKDASGQHRLVYSMESPEPWFEDFGEAKLSNGRADVALDTTFAEIAHTDTYHVFLTEYDDHNLLFVTKRTAGGFEVRAKSGVPSGIFSYRVVARRKDITGERLAKFDLPKIKIPDESKLPKPVPSPLPPSKP